MTTTERTIDISDLRPGCRVRLLYSGEYATIAALDHVGDNGTRGVLVCVDTIQPDGSRPAVYGEQVVGAHVIGAGTADVEPISRDDREYLARVRGEVQS